MEFPTSFGPIGRTRSVPTWSQASDVLASDDVPSSGSPGKGRDYFKKSYPKPKWVKPAKAIKPTISKDESPKAPVSPRPEGGAAAAVPKGAAPKKSKEASQRADLLRQKERKAKGLEHRECKGEESPVSGGKH
jgi:hypothetical protein